MPTGWHAAIDYLLAAGTLALGLSRPPRTAARRVLLGVPAWNAGYTVLTDYEGGVVPLLSMREHLLCDTAGALALLGTGLLATRDAPRDRWLLAGLGAAELLVIALSDRHRR